MNIRDSYIHGADGKGVVKTLFFATTADVQAGISVNDLVFQLADTIGTQVPLTIPTLNQNTTGSAGSYKVVKSTSANNHYLTFVDSIIIQQQLLNLFIQMVIFTIILYTNVLS